MVTNSSKTQLENLPIDELSEGLSRQYSKQLTERDVILFAATSGDVNPVHLDATYAATTTFGEPIGHGMWTGALVSAAIATTLPGPGSIYRGQSLQFKKPVKIGDTITVTLTVESIRARVALVTLKCEAHNQHNVLVATGTAEVIAPKQKQRLHIKPLPLITLEEV